MLPRPGNVGFVPGPDIRIVGTRVLRVEDGQDRTAVATSLVVCLALAVGSHIPSAARSPLGIFVRTEEVIEWGSGGAFLS
jgi:hypothetical protein